MRKLTLILLCLFVSGGMLIAGGQKDVPVADTEIIAGTYEGLSHGFHGDLPVSVDVDSTGKIVSVSVGKNSETKNIGTLAIDRIPGQIVENQSFDVDSISGATVTTKAILAATAQAVEQAGMNPADLGYVAPKAPAFEMVRFDAAALPVKSEKTGTVTVTDARGREVTIETPISSYGISTMDVIDFIIPFMGEEAFKMLVAAGQDGGGGIQRYARLYSPIVGNYNEHVGQISEHNAPFDLEMILATDPDVIFINAAMGAHGHAMDIEDQLDAAGIPFVCISIPGKDVSTASQKAIGLIAKVFQKEEEAQDVIGFIDDQFAVINEKDLQNRDDKPLVYYEKGGHEEIFGRTSTSAPGGWGHLVTYSGGFNIADPLLFDTIACKATGNTLDPEYVLETNPDYVVMSAAGDAWMTNFSDDPTPDISFDIVKRIGWNELKAVQNDQVYDLSHAMWRSVYSFNACQFMAKKFYPDLFTDLDPDAVMDEFFERFMLTDSSITRWTFSIDE